MDESGLDAQQERALAVMDTARRLFEEGDRFGSGRFDPHRGRGMALFVCAVTPTSEEVEALD